MWLVGKGEHSYGGKISLALCVYFDFDISFYKDT